MFGRSHKTTLIYRNVFLRKKKKIKKKFIIYGPSLNQVSHTSNLSLMVRPNDLYTDRGIRFSKYMSRRKLGAKGPSTLI